MMRLFPTSQAVILRDHELIAYLRSKIRAARHRLWISQFLIDVRPQEDHERELLLFCHGIGEAAWRGLDVRILLPRHPLTSLGYDANHPARRFLAFRQVPVRIAMPTATRPHHHAKLVLLDNGILVVGSHNWTPASFRRNQEMAIAVQSPAAVADAAVRYLTWWENGEPEDVTDAA